MYINRAQSKPDAGDMSRITALEKEIATATAQLERLQEKSGSIQDEIKALEKKILEIGGARLLSQKSKVDGLRLHIKLANDELTKAEVDKAKAEKDMTKFESTLQSSQEELEEAQDELAEWEEQLTQVAELMKELESKVEIAKAAEEEWSEKLAAMKEEVESMSEGVQAFRQRQVRRGRKMKKWPRILNTDDQSDLQMKLTQDVNDMRKKFNDNKATMEHWMAEHDQLQLEEVE